MNKNSCLKLLIGFLAIVGLNISPAAVEAHHKPGHLLGPPTSAGFAIVQPLAFGTISPEITGGTLTVSDTGTVSVTGTVISLGGAFNALLTVNSCAGSVTTLVITNGVLTGPGADIVITSMTCTGPGEFRAPEAVFFRELRVLMSLRWVELYQSPPGKLPVYTMVPLILPARIHPPVRCLSLSSRAVNS